MILPISIGCIMLLISIGFVWQRQFTKTTLLLILGFPFIAILLYWHWGNPNMLLNPPLSFTQNKNLPDANQVIQALQQHLAHEPNSAQGWFLLGRLYASQQKYEDASKAFARANTLQPDQMNILINYVMSLFMQRTVDNQQIETLLKHALTLEPQNDTALNLLAINFYQQQQYDKAISIWEKLSEKYPPDTTDGKTLLKAISIAQQKSTAKKTE
jgi:cytochrome c-type biogenesis protein CcmH